MVFSGPDTLNFVANAFDKLENRYIVHDLPKLREILSKASNQVGDHMYAWLADKINEMPLYTHYKKAPYQDNYLTTIGKKVTVKDIKSLFTDPKSVFTRQLGSPTYSGDFEFIPNIQYGYE